MLRGAGRVGDGYAAGATLAAQASPYLSVLDRQSQDEVSQSLVI